MPSLTDDILLSHVPRGPPHTEVIMRMAKEGIFHMINVSLLYLITSRQEFERMECTATRGRIISKADN